MTARPALVDPDAENHRQGALANLAVSEAAGDPAWAQLAATQALAHATLALAHVVDGLLPDDEPVTA